MTSPFPSRAELRIRLQDLIAGRTTREHIAAWAGRALLEDLNAVPTIDEHDLIALRVIESLATADLPTSRTDYLYSELDFRDWLADLDSKPSRT